MADTVWWIPVVSTLSGSVISAVALILNDWLKTKREFELKAIDRAHKLEDEDRERRYALDVQERQRLREKAEALANGKSRLAAVATKLYFAVEDNEIDEAFSEIKKMVEQQADLLSDEQIRSLFILSNSKKSDPATVAAAEQMILRVLAENKSE